MKYMYLTSDAVSECQCNDKIESLTQVLFILDNTMIKYLVIQK